MRCKYCGRETSGNAEICSYCILQLKSKNSIDSSSKPPENTIAVVGFVLSFFVAIAGLICSIIGYNRALNDGAPHKELAKAGIILSAIATVWGFIAIIIYVSVIITALI
ncbi:MAG: hypothetical protein K2O44_06740 [Clostridia bacterium]|nr:hypothetical protein [Clostridia bacterium]